MMRGKYTLAGFVLAALLILPACAGAVESSPELAAVRMVSSQVESSAVVYAESIHVLQQQAFQGSTYVVLSYDRTWNGHDQNCLSVYETHQKGFAGWTAGSGVGSCTNKSETANLEPMDISGGTSFSQDPNQPDISHVLGKVNDENIARISVSWEDGAVQTAQVVNGSVLAIRAGDMQMKSAVGLSEGGAVIHTVGNKIQP